MNEAQFYSQVANTRVKFNPLSTQCQLTPLTPASPLAQVVNTLLDPIEYEPDRSNSPLLLLPTLRVIDVDGIFPANANQYLSLDYLNTTVEGKYWGWTVNGQPIAEIWDNDDYEVFESADDMRGCLKVYRNLTVGETETLRFTGRFLDWRTNRIYDVQSDEKVLSAREKGADQYGCSIDKPELQYDPLYDDLLLYEYMVAKGLANAGSRNSYVNAKCYEQTFTVTFTSGATKLNSLPSGVTMRLVRLGSTTALVANSVDSPEVMQITFPYIKLDMRLVDNQDYEVQFLLDGEVIQKVGFTAQTVVSMPDAKATMPAYSAYLPVSLTWYQNRAIVNLPNRFINYPALYYKIQWYTRAVGASSKAWQLGDNMGAAVADLDLGNTAATSIMNVWFTLKPHDVLQVIADESGEALTDENGEILIG